MPKRRDVESAEEIWALIDRVRDWFDLFSRRIPASISSIRNYSEGGSTWAPPIDVLDTGKDIVILAEVPGIAREDIDISLLGDTVLVKGTKKMPRIKEGQRAVRVEREYGPFAWEYRLPVKAEKLDQGRINANLKDGLLVITVPIGEIDKPKRVEIC